MLFLFRIKTIRLWFFALKKNYRFFQHSFIVKKIKILSVSCPWMSLTIIGNKLKEWQDTVNMKLILLKKEEIENLDWRRSDLGCDVIKCQFNSNQLLFFLKGCIFFLRGYWLPSISHYVDCVLAQFI